MLGTGRRLSYNDEKSLGCAIGLAYYCTRKNYKMIRELPTDLDFADVVFLPLPFSRKPAMFMEIKYAYEAIRQMKERECARDLEDYAGEILLVGVYYDKDDRNKIHSCVIEKI